MKRILSLVAAILLLGTASTEGTFAQEMKRSSPGTMKVLADTTLVRAEEVTLAPGQKTGVHSHPAHFFYALTDCRLRVHYTDGKNEDYDLKAGESGYSNPERPHVTENAGSETARFLIVELKEHPYKSPK